MKPCTAACMLLLALPLSATAQESSSSSKASQTQLAQVQEGKSGFDHGFYIQSADGAFVFRPFGLIHTDLRLVNSGRQINTDATQASTFVVRRLRIGFEGQLYGSIAYDLETNVGSGGAELIYAWMNFGHVPQAQVRVGQFKEPFSYEVLLPETSLDFVERSVVATVVAPAEDIGAMLHNFGAPIGGVLEYGVGMFNGLGATLEKTDPDKTFEYTGRLAVYPFARSTSSRLKGTRLAAYALFEGNRPPGVDIRPRTPLGFEFMPRMPTEGRRLAVGGDVQFILGPFSTKAEYIRNMEDTSANRDVVTNGWHVDVTHVVTGEDKVLRMVRGFEITARIEQLRVDAGSPTEVVDFTDELGNAVFFDHNRVTTLTIGANHYLNYNTKFQINYQSDWFGDSFFTPTSRTGNILKAAPTFRPKVLARVQLYF